MKTRDFRAADEEVIRRMPQAESFGIPFPDLSKMESIRVVEDEFGRPIAACAAEKIVQLYFWSESMPPHATLHAIRLLHAVLTEELLTLGYHEANAFVPPPLAARFGRRLERSFGWMANWSSWFIRF